MINNHIDEFEINVDLLDLKTGDYQSLVLENEVPQLSERDYS